MSTFGAVLLVAAVIAVILFVKRAQLAGNRRDVPPTSNQERDKAIKDGPPPNHGVVFVLRDNQRDGSSLGIDVEVIGLAKTQLLGSQFSRLTLPVGKHVLTAGPKSAFAAKQFVTAECPLDITAGTVIVFALTMTRRFDKNTLELKLLDTEIGLAELSLFSFVGS